MFKTGTCHVQGQGSSFYPHEAIDTNKVHGSQQVEVLPSLVRDCKKPLYRNRLFWGSGIGYF